MAEPNAEFQIASERFQITEDFLARYNRPGPRYTSYPTAPVWQDNFGPRDLEQAFADADAARTPLSLYMHFPYCESLCLFCACNVVISRDKTRRCLPISPRCKMKSSALRESVSRERQVVQFHWGGGTPTYLAPAQMEDLFGFARERFTFAPDAEIGIEVDPRVTTHATPRNAAPAGIQPAEPRHPGFSS